MEKLVKKLLVATGLIAGSAVALLPLTSYAAVVTDTSDPHGVYNCSDAPGSSNPCARADKQDLTDAEGNPTGKSGSTTVTVNVDSLLAIDAVSLTCSGDGDTCVDTDAKTKAIQAAPGLVRTGTLAVNVRSAKSFTISVSAEEPYLMGYDSEGNNTGVIIPASNAIDGKNNGWGIQKSGEDTYTAVKTQPQVFYTGEAQDNFKDVNLRIGVSANSNIPQGMYSTEVTVTAATVGTD